MRNFRSWLSSCLILLCSANAEIGPQLRDFLCGCEYCKTVRTGEPLDIGSHMLRCHSWRVGMQKTIDLMNQTSRPNVVVEEKPANVTVTAAEDDDRLPHEDYSWKVTEQFGWAYATTGQLQFDIDQWLYIDRLKWVWTIAGEPRYLYSYDYGWLYTRLYIDSRIYYWYDKRRWFLSKDINND